MSEGTARGGGVDNRLGQHSAMSPESACGTLVAWVASAEDVRVVTSGVRLAERLAGLVCLLMVLCTPQASATLAGGSVVSASAFGLPEYGAGATAGVLPADEPQVVNFLVVGDFNGDGRPDVMAVRALYQSNRTFPVVVLLNQGNGTFVDQTSSVFDGAPPWDEPPPFYLNDGHGNFTALPPGLGAGAGDVYNFIDAFGNSERDIVYTLNNSSVELIREQTPHGHRLYATVTGKGAVSLVSDQGPRARIRAGHHQLVVWDQDAQARFNLTGPGVNVHTSTGSVISFLTVRLRAGGQYRYSGGPGHHGTIRVAA